MADVAKVLAQAIPPAGVLTDVYVAPAPSVVSTMKACNQSTAPTVIRVSVAVAGAADTPKQYLHYDLPLAGNDSFGATEGWTLAATDVVRCQSGNGQVSFNFFGATV